MSDQITYAYGQNNEHLEAVSNAINNVASMQDDLHKLHQTLQPLMQGSDGDGFQATMLHHSNRLDTVHTDLRTINQQGFDSQIEAAQRDNQLSRDWV